jgi:Xaa-Pro aminopeptidase
MFVGEPDDRQRRYFELMCEAQQVAIDALEPGRPVSEVDAAVAGYFEEQGIADLARHHVGHNIGLGAHEPPYIDEGSDATVEPGHVYTIEPGIYTDDAGYRHSDTVVVTETGTERLTYFPRDVDANTIE